MYSNINEEERKFCKVYLLQEANTWVVLCHDPTDGQIEDAEYSLSL